MWIVSWDPFLIKQSCWKKKFVSLVHCAQDILTNQFPRKMLASQRGGGSHAQCTRPTERYSKWNVHEKKKEKKKKKKRKTLKM